LVTGAVWAAANEGVVIRQLHGCCGRLAVAREGAAGPAGRTESASAQVRDGGQQGRRQPSWNAGTDSVRRRNMSGLPEADELIAGQYADRPQLRPVFDEIFEYVF
jgi:hypothetical protein